MWPYQTTEAVEQNLRDAGCDEECIRKFMEDLRQSREKEGLKLLKQHRRCLVDGTVGRRGADQKENEKIQPAQN